MSSTFGGTTSRRQALTRLTVGVATALAATALVVAPASANTTSGSAAGVPLTDGSMYNVVDQIGARALWEQGITGRGVNVAIIDTGVADVDALAGADKVVAMVDLSDEAGLLEASYVDTYGHGTHMAGIIAGRDPGADPAAARNRPDWFLGVAPDAGIVSVKVAGHTGAADVSQVIAGVDWVVDHAGELGIRVLNLSYSSGSTLGYLNDPLSFAVERAWRAGITVVVAAGNDGHNAFELGMPAQNPYVIAVAGAELKKKKWKVPTWATSGDGTRNPDLAAPATSIVSLRAPDSTVDLSAPSGYVSEHLFKGSGSSQAAAVVSGAAALLLSARPGLTPDQVKALLNGTAKRNAITPKDTRKSGNGLLDVAAARSAATPGTVQARPPADGSGSLEAARGGAHVSVNGALIQGEVTVLGMPWAGPTWVGARWAGARWAGQEWTDGDWMGARWAGARWAGARWAGASWTGARWAGARWAGARWASEQWAGARWASDAWTIGTWDGARWAGARWAGGAWTGARWAEATWS